MKLSRISLLLLLIFLLVPSVSYAQSSASKSWNAFWTKFSAAVKRKNKVAVKRLMSSESEFFSGGGSENRSEWLQMIDDRRAWSDLQKSVASGTVAYNEGGRTGRITKDRVLIFQYFGGKWQFVGVMGD